MMNPIRCPMCDRPAFVPWMTGGPWYHECRCGHFLEARVSRPMSDGRRQVVFKARRKNFLIERERIAKHKQRMGVK